MPEISSDFSVLLYNALMSGCALVTRKFQKYLREPAVWMAHVFFGIPFFRLLYKPATRQEKNHF